jgi:hypothetical protein
MNVAASPGIRMTRLERAKTHGHAMGKPLLLG